MQPGSAAATASRSLPTPVPACGLGEPGFGLTLALPNFGDYLPEVGLPGLVEIARMAEEAGVDRVSVADHVVMGTDLSSYPWGELTLDPSEPFHEPLVVLSAMAARTSRIRLATGILVAPLRPPAVLAKMAATLDQLSRGRFDLGVGVGWQRAEYQACGVDFDSRWQLLSQALERCSELWGDQPVAPSAVGMEDASYYCVPTPYQRGGVPLWLGGGTSPPNLRRLANWCTGWLPIPVHGATAADVAATLRKGVPLVHEAFVEAGRDAGELRVSVSLPLVKQAGEVGSNLDESLSALDQLVDAGATDISVPVHAFCRSMDDMPSFLAALVAGVRARISGEVGRA